MAGDGDGHTMPTAFVTCPPDHAGELADQLVDEQLAACVNRMACTSTYRWEGEVITEDEEILLVKTTEECYEALADRVVELHPHEVPCIERFDAESVHDPYAAWVAETTG